MIFELTQSLLNSLVVVVLMITCILRSEERRVGKECRL